MLLKALVCPRSTAKRDPSSKYPIPIEFHYGRTTATRISAIFRLPKVNNRSIAIGRCGYVLDWPMAWTDDLQAPPRLCSIPLIA